MGDDITLVPISLEFRGVAREANLSIALNTPGVAWSMGDAEDGEVGFSLNPMALSGSAQSCIHSIELAESVLAIQTGAKATSDSFTLSAFLRTPINLQNIDGYCSINDGARVIAYLQHQRPVEWRGGPVSATLTEGSSDFLTARIRVRGLKAGRSVRLRLKPESFQGGRFRWSLGPPLSLGSGVAIRTSDNSRIGVSNFSMSETTIDFVCGPSVTAAGARELIVELCVQCVGSPSEWTDKAPKGSDWLSLMVECDPDVVVIAQIGSYLPQYVTDGFTPFSL